MNRKKPYKCLCGSMPIIKEKKGGCLGKLYKYRCPNCHEKELPWLGQWNDCGALREWNKIALKKQYRKRTLKYNEHGVCVSKPSEILEWEKGNDSIIVKIYKDNGRFYYCCKTQYKQRGVSFGLWIGDKGYTTMDLLKENIKKKLEELIGKNRGAMKVINTLIPEVVLKK
jgi:hypothetical protein